MKRKAYKKKNPIQLFTYYLRVWGVIFRKSLSKSVAYRFDLISRVVRTLMILGIQLILVQAIYAGTDSVAGWAIEDYYLLLGIFNFVNYISWGLFSVNLWRLEEKVVKGEFDFLLLSPSGSIFTTAFNEFFLDDAIASISGILLIVYYFINFGEGITLVAVLGGLVAVLAAFVIWFSLHLAVAAFNFVILKNGLLDMLKSFTRIGSFPPDIFSQNIRIMLYTLFPVALIAAVPTRILTGVYSWPVVLYTVLIAVISLTISVTIWKWSLRSYTSAEG